MNDNGYHPTARCDTARDLYFAWVKVTQEHKRGSKEYRAAWEEYMAHIQGGCNCRKGLGK